MINIVNTPLPKRPKKGITQVKALIGAVIVILVAVAMVPIIANSVEQAQNNTNVTASQGSMLDIALLLFVVGIVMAGVAWSVSGGGN